MNSLQETINQIIEERKTRLGSIEKQKLFWDELAYDFNRLSSLVLKAENSNPGPLGGISVMIQNAAGSAADVAKAFKHISDRFGQKDICIGIGGAARMGKSTFLQAVTGLGDDQIPISDRYYTTAGRSLIVNAPRKEAVADMHTEASFLEKVIAPMCRTLKIPVPGSMAEFQSIELPVGETQEEMDVINRIKDTIHALPVIRKELTGEKARRIEIEDLRDYVAYPKDGQSKAGKFMAVSDIVIYAPFPETAIRQLRVVDLPGLGEAGRDLAEIQTNGMAEICDITLLMKLPVGANVAWNLNDTKALDAMKNALPLLEDQTKYTAILANVNGEDADRADACVADIRRQLSQNGREFAIIRCDARDKKSVLSDTMPEILSFLAKNLPAIDKAILSKAEAASDQAKTGIRKTLQDVKNTLSQLTRKSSGSSHAFRDDLFDKILKSLSQYSGKLHQDAEKPDEEWNREVQRVTGLVKAWVSNGCGYGSRENLQQIIADEILAVKGQPTRTVNQLRIAFREQWEVIDEHLQARIGNTLEGFIQAIQSCTNSLVPPCDTDAADYVDALRKQLNALADKLMNTPDQDPGDDIALNGLAAPLRRLSEFDLRFRFHLEPTLIAATEVLISNKLPLVADQNDAEMFTDKVIALLTEKADEYSRTMIAARTSETAFGKKVRLIEGAVKDETVRKELISMLQSAVSSAQSFCPNRIFAAVVENAADAFLRFQERDRAFEAMVRGYGSELREKPTPAVQAALDAYAEISNILKKVR